MKIIFILILISFIFAGNAVDNAPKTILTDFQFTNQINYKHFYSLIKAYDNCFSNKQIDYIYEMGKKNNVSQIILLAKLQQEQSLVNDKIKCNLNKRMSWAMSYCLHYKGKCYASGSNVCPHVGFYNQVYHSARRLKELFNNGKGKTELLIGWNKDFKTISVNNQATYALYKYTPIWDSAIDGGKRVDGNKMFLEIYNSFYNKYIEIQNEKK